MRKLSNFRRTASILQRKIRKRAQSCKFVTFLNDFSLKQIEFLETELEELKTQRKSHENPEILMENRDFSDNSSSFPQFRSQTANLHEKIKQECEKNLLFEDEVRVISKTEDREIREKLGDCESKLRDFQGKNQEIIEELRRYEEKNRILQEKLSKLLTENAGISEKNQGLSEENLRISQENRDLKENVECLKKKLGNFEKMVSFISLNLVFLKKLSRICQFLRRIRDFPQES